MSKKQSNQQPSSLGISKTMPSAMPTSDLLQRERVLANAKPIRGPHSIPHPRQVKNTFCRIFSIKAGMRIVQTESLLEADAIYWAESQPAIVSLCEQPIRIPIPVEKHSYITLDLGLKNQNGLETFYEIKPDAKLTELSDGSRRPPHWSLIESWCKHHGFASDVLTDIELNKAKRRIQNWRLLLPFVRIAKEFQNPTVETQVMEAVEVHSALCFGEIHRYVPNSDAQSVYAAIAHLLHRGRLDADLDSAPLTQHTKIKGVDHA